MKKWTKLLSLLLMLGMLTASLFACSGCSDTEPDYGTGGKDHPDTTLENDNQVEVGDLLEGLK